MQSGAFSNVINLFSGSESRYPLEYGKNILVVLENKDNLKNLSESEFYTRNTKATSLIVLTKEDLFDNNLESTDETFKAILKDQEFEMTLNNKISNKDIENMVAEGSIGTIFYPIEDGISKAKIKSLINISNKTKTPVLFSKSTYPYKTIGILVNNDFGENTSNSIAFDLASSLSASLIAVNISQPKFLQSDDASQLTDSLEKMQDLALSYEVQLDFENHEGNEAKIFSNLSSSLTFQLLEMGQTNHGKLGKQQNSYLIIQNLQFYLYQVNLWKSLKQYP